MLPHNALALAHAFALAHGLKVSAFYEFESHDKVVVAVNLRRDGEIFEPTRRDGTVAFARMPRVILRADGTVFRDLLFNPFA
jgi:hypothetical protein